MLKFLTAASLCLALAFGQMESESGSGESSGESGSQITGSNYFRYGFGTFYFAFAVNKCSATDILGSSYIYPTCVDDEHIAVSWYATSDCSDDPSSSLMYNKTNTDVVFLCGGEDTYVGVSLGAGDCTATLYAGIDACVQYSSLSTSTYSSFTCSSSDSASLSVYTSSTCSGTAVTSLEFGTSCDFIFTSSSVDVYGQIEECSAATVMTTGSGESTSEDDDDDGEDDDGTGSDTTTSSPTEETPGSSGNMISLNIFGIFAMISLIIANL